MARPIRVFAFRLALALGYPHPDFLLASISAQQFEEWIAYSEMEPFGYEIENFRAGQIAATVANCMSSRHDWKASDFMPKKKQKPKSLAQTIAEAFGATGRK